MKNVPAAKLAAGPLLFDPPQKAANVYVANVDGASRGNPGPASYAVILRGPDGAIRFEIGKYLGRATNNVAEYYALITALDYAAAQGIERLLVRSDSELLVRQMQGRYKVNSADLRPLHERARKLTRGLAHFTIEHVPREQNREADQLANRALDETSPAARKTPADSPAAGLGRSKRSAATPEGGQRVRARYSGGVLQLLDQMELAEGEIVEIRLIRTSRE